ncbi:glycosyltransferase family 2 protein [Geomonas sp. Red32]|uniref:glycosyltransferase family 2 protein n=1 Tax=Geomonas sp. Red32 TaxID=2912856 RepID=UPI00202CF4DC|nr:glycosyltransferase family 2 protein [Geomonas sp. Red32]MCM0084050.1 glycosyltransferase family 2 protein [Geomonas sp. Red32]
MQRSFRVAAVVVLYRPEREVADNLRSYLGQVETLFAVDNSDDDAFAEVAASLGLKVSYLPNFANLGIATGLNRGADEAVDADFDFLLTMDQDSKAEPGMIEEMLGCLDDMDVAKVGMLSPFHVTKSEHKPGSERCQEVMTPMTSGCLLNLQAYRAVGPFLDKLFIDFVDNEYCLRLRSRGYRVLRANRARLLHSVGDTIKYGPFIATNHSPLRRYYKTRNRFLIFTMYLRAFPGHCLFDLVRLVKEIGSIVLFEGEKGKKLVMMAHGLVDFIRGRYGKYGG